MIDNGKKTISRKGGGDNATLLRNGRRGLSLVLLCCCSLQRKGKGLKYDKIRVT